MHILGQKVKVKKSQEIAKTRKYRIKNRENSKIAKVKIYYI